MYLETAESQLDEQAATTPAALRAALAAAQREIAELREQLAIDAASKEQLRRDLELRTGALDAASSHFMIIDATQLRAPTIVFVNRCLANDHGYEPEELIGKRVVDLKLKYRSVGERQRLLDAMAKGEAARCEADAVRRDGTTFTIGFHTAPLPTRDGRITHYVTVGADITARIESERKKAELQEQLYSEMRERERIAIELRLAQKLESVGRLAAGMAHEINTPIQYVGDSVYFLRSAFEDFSKLGFFSRDAIRELAEKTGDTEVLDRLREREKEIDFEFLRQEAPKAFERTLEGVERVASIVRAMKEFAHPDATEHSPADLNHALETTLTVARAEYKYTATVDTQLGELPPVLCNVGELNQVFLNLIVNAAHAIHDSGKDMSTGRIVITTSLCDDWAHIAVADNGCGIPQQNMEKIFDPFFTTKDVGRGTGQGLAIARSIVVDKHGGFIDVSSEVGAGTKFLLKLPVAGRKVSS